MLIGGGPLILDPSAGYERYFLYKFHHTVPIYIFYATICDEVVVSIQSRVPLPGFAAAFEEGVAIMRDAVAKPAARGRADPLLVEPTPETKRQI